MSKSENKWQTSRQTGEKRLLRGDTFTFPGDGDGAETRVLIKKSCDYVNTQPYAKSS